MTTTPKMDSIIRKNTMSSRNVIDPIDFAELAGSPMRMAFAKLYFFFKSELNVSPHQSTSDESYNAFKQKNIRHLIPYKGHYYDYIVNKEYDTLEEWAIDNNQNVWDIVYGVNSVHNREPSRRVVEYITLDKLLEFLDPDYQGDVPILQLPISTHDIIQDVMTEINGMTQQLELMKSKLSSLL